MGLSAAEEKELAQLEAQYSKPKKSALSAAEEKELAQLEAQYGQKQKGLVPDSVRSEFERGDLLGPALRVADAPGGFMRTGLANSAGLLMGKGNIVTEEDLAKTAWGEAPKTEEYLRRLGVPEGPKAFGISARDAAGFVGDTLTDPVGRIAKGLGLAKEVSPLSQVAESAGTSMYKSGLKNVDKKLAEKGKVPVSDLLLKERKTGSVQKLAKDAEEIGSRAKSQRGKLYQEASDLGARVDVSDAVKNAREIIADVRKDKNLHAAADKMEQFLNNYTSEGFVDLDTLSTWKTNLYDALPDSAFQGGRLKGPFKRFEQVLARDFKSAIERGADEAAPGLGKKIKDANEVMGSTISARKPFTNEINKAVTPNYVTVMDALGPGGLGVFTGQMTGDPIKGLLTGGAALALKKGAEASRTTAFRTKGGLLLKDLGGAGLLDAGARRAVIDYMKDKKKK